MKISKYTTKRFVNKAITSAMMLVMIVMASCEKEIDIEYYDIPALPVIEAQLTQNSIEVRITQTTPMDESIEDTPIFDATVTITDLTEGERYQLVVDDEGVYRNPISGVAGHEYQLDVEIGDKHYTSTSRMFQPVAIVDATFFWVKMPGDDMAALRLLMLDNPMTEDYNWIRIYRNGEPYMWDLLSDIGAVDGILGTVITTSHRDESQETEKQVLRDGDVVTVETYPVDKKMYNNLVALTNGNNGYRMFTGDECLGYFIASSVSRIDIVYHPESIEYAK